ncbi:hypothetical protein GGI07_000931 [Coemansia sp. Benny D115]|nr:hypothetical protein GGI07_000931 [Coemansia sp. Benny D115]
MHPFLVKRLLETGPENPADVFHAAVIELNSKQWKFRMANGLGGSLCGAMVCFLICVHFWRPALVNRKSLRLIFAISVYDFLECIIQTASKSATELATCRASFFFSSFFGHASIYTSTSIAVNLHMTLFGKRTMPSSRYAELLYFVVPLCVSFLHWAPPTIWAAAHGYCSAFEPIQGGTPKYIIYVIFVQLLLPLVSLLINIIISVRIIIMLARQQAKISRSLKAVSSQTCEYLLQANTVDSETRMNPVSDQNSQYEIETKRQLERSFLVMRKFNSAAIRIALYPCAPIAWWVINAMFYIIQYDLTMTFKSDSSRWVYMISLAWFTIPALAFTNFVVFFTDPAFIKVQREVHKSLTRRFHKQQSTHASGNKGSAGSQALGNRSMSDFDRTWSSTHVRLDKEFSKHTNNGSVLFEAESIRGSFETKYYAPSFSYRDDNAESAIDTSSQLATLQHTHAMGHSSALMNTYGDLVKRHPTTGNGADANVIYSHL